MGFRTRLALFFVVTLVAVQALTASLVYEITRRAMITEGERQLAATANAFTLQMDDISRRVAAVVEVLSLDYALRSAIAELDQGTVQSVLRNHGRRVGASRMQFVDLNGMVQVDTAAVGSAPWRFPFPDLIESAYVRRSAAVVAVEGKAYWMVVVPIYAPQVVGLVVASIPLDNAQLAHMQQLSATPKDIELAALVAPGTWSVLARGTRNSKLTGHFVEANLDLPTQSVLANIDGTEYLVLSQRLQQPNGSAPVAAVLGYSLDDALRPFRAVAVVWAGLLLLGLGVGLIGAWMTARSVSMPIEALASSARRIEKGDYRAMPDMRRADEIGQLAEAFATMSEAVRQREERIRYQALHDGVTGLPNRVQAEATIDSSPGIHANTGGALLMIGLTRVPDITKTMGHVLGDRLMREASKRVERVAAGAFLARATDAQFLLWLPGAHRREAAAVSIRILGTLNEPYRETNVTIDMLPAIGIALAPEHGSRANELLRHAEVAQFAGGNTSEAIAYYEPATDPHRPERLSLMGELRQAVDNDALDLHYQPKLKLDQDRVDGAEALVRWQHAKRGCLPPDDFIVMAEETGNIQLLTRWALASAIAQTRQWSLQGCPLQVAVNLSPRDLDDPALPDRIRRLLSIHEVSTSSLTVEITERAVIHEGQAVTRVLRELADMGIGIAIDDFGVGQSSLASLRSLPVRELKIDRMFVEHLARGKDDKLIVRSIVDLSHQLGYHVTAEGVEDEDALAYLRMIGCDHAQGFLISPALAADKLVGFLEQRVARAVV